MLWNLCMGPISQISVKIVTFSVAIVSFRRGGGGGGGGGGGLVVWFAYTSMTRFSGFWCG